MCEITLITIQRLLCAEKPADCRWWAGMTPGRGYLRAWVFWEDARRRSTGWRRRNSPRIFPRSVSQTDPKP
ncbi:hypothetical protein AGR2A_Lc30016 [Agrobacterium genomosp. 2 str. CFBP 5494]|uniref:Uncharacterized protein n=1 Tax=Agrobacterium genomosp. 2 str. CFBP 5494 TaxID=1183436 RepID=A0A9W5B411_9HYPH|nr:hypothetical protein AGR2A_Lc30016 [Agrobacterium genomosp. 2 str. CFBP 5494]